MNKIQCNFYKVLYYMVLVSPLSIIGRCLLTYYSVVEKNELMYNIALIATVVFASPIIIVILWAFSDYIEELIIALKITIIELTQNKLGYIVVVVYTAVSALVIITKEPLIIIAHLLVLIWILNIKKESIIEEIEYSRSRKHKSQIIKRFK